jgi:hypothetical protein
MGNADPPDHDHQHANAISNSHDWEQRPVYPQSLAERYGAIETIEPCSRCGETGMACYACDCWGFTPRSRCGDPCNCGEKPSINAGPFLHIVGGRP